MVTIKSFTDLPQSKKLAEFLPPKSADMSYSFDFDSGIYEISTASYKSWVVPKYARPNNGFDKVIPCWSLAALLNIIQKTTPYKMEYFGDKKVQLTCVLGDKPWELIISDFNNEIDACYEMILKLHELKML